MLILPFWTFPDFERKVFQTFGRKTSKICQNYLLRVQRNNLWLEFFLSFESFPIFCSNHWHGSQNSIYVSGVKKCRKKICFFVFLFRIVSNFERYIFRLLAKTLQKFSKLSFACPQEPFVAWIFFKFAIVSDFLQKPLAWFSKFYLRVQSKNCGKNSFFCFSFHIFFSNFERYIFRFWPKHFKSFQNYFLRVQRNHLCL